MAGADDDDGEVESGVGMAWGGSNPSCERNVGSTSNPSMMETGGRGSNPWSSNRGGWQFEPVVGERGRQRSKAVAVPMWSELRGAVACRTLVVPTGAVAHSNPLVPGRSLANRSFSRCGRLSAWVACGDNTPRPNYCIHRTPHSVARLVLLRSSCGAGDAGVGPLAKACRGYR